MKITENIFQVGGDALSGPGDAAVYLVVFGGHGAIIDAGCGQGHKKIIDGIAQCTCPRATVDSLFLTHCHFDHTGGADALRKHYGCPVVAHEQDARFLEEGNNEVTAASWYGASLSPFTVDHRIRGHSEEFRIGSGTLRAFHWPGHSPGSVVYLTESEGKKVLFGQDVHGPLHPSLLSNRDDYLASLTMIIGLEADILCEGHFGVIKGKQEVHRFIQSYMK